jgi:hypothetical protein
VEFFFGFYDMEKDDLIQVLEESRNFGKILGALSTNFIALISNKDNLGSFNDFRFISFYNCISR